MNRKDDLLLWKLLGTGRAAEIRKIYSPRKRRRTSKRRAKYVRTKVATYTPPHERGLDEYRCMQFPAYG
jgi:hypothetical protein